MLLDCAGVSTHLSYCTNIHPGDTWTDTFTELKKQLPKVRNAMGQTDAMGVGLRLSGKSAQSLCQQNTLRDFKQWLDHNGYYIYTINGFPFGAFHGERVKEDVYKPDWTEQTRLDYTCQLANILVELDPPDQYGSISTMPGTYKDWMMPGSEEAICENLIKAVAHCVGLYQTTGTTIALAIEPEPCCMLETVNETIQFFSQWLFSEQAINKLAKLAKVSQEDADRFMHRHIGVCYDVCHSAVEFEKPAHAIARLRSAGIEIIKIQLSSALEIPNVTEASLRHLNRFDEPVYLHQVVEKYGDTITRFNDITAASNALRYRIDSRSTLDPALKLSIYGSAARSAIPVFRPIEEPITQWRVHFHVPVFTEQLEHFNTTQKDLLQVLQLQKLNGFCKHLEIETYTWDVLPEAFRQVSIGDAISREINWVKDRL